MFLRETTNFIKPIFLLYNEIIKQLERLKLLFFICKKRKTAKVLVLRLKVTASIFQTDENLILSFFARTQH